MLLIMILACTQDTSMTESCPDISEDTSSIVEPETPIEPEEPAEEPEEPEDFSMWEGASLRITSPQPAQLIPIGAEQEFIAELISAEGDVLELDEENILWSTDQSEDWSFNGTFFTDNTLPVGAHIIEAEAILPNNNRLVYALGGIRVQHPDAGTYSGTTTINATFSDWNGNETVVSCAGAAILVVNLEGTQALGDSACILQLFGQAQETTYNFEIDLNGSDLSGLAIADFVIAQRDFPLTGTISNGVITADWADMVYGILDVEGQIDLEKVSD